MNKYINQRLKGLLAILNSVNESTLLSASASKGAARAYFINNFLKQVIPTDLRISTSGEITDEHENITGELDIIIENGQFPSIPMLGIDNSRIFFSESVAAVIEVKSNLKNQWTEVVATGQKLNSINRSFRTNYAVGKKGPTVIQVQGNFANLGLGKIAPQPEDFMKTKIPYFVVGYQGWENASTIKLKLEENSEFISGILQLDKELFISNNVFENYQSQGVSCLFDFLDCIHEASSFIKLATTDLHKYNLNI
ncbi:DUF6602 domain-containing protein [Chryseobacterium sp.]|uniref:DUF6602 domain-containing protein n=1 Tax=Chryseobacterium sp. TaxID=1871047 RepID=UPI00289E50A1|nr:DUF6602 domain-containing protein [Chryseobacterium sp.]